MALPREQPYLCASCRGSRQDIDPDRAVQQVLSRLLSLNEPHDDSSKPVAFHNVQIGRVLMIGSFLSRSHSSCLSEARSACAESRSPGTAPAGAHKHSRPRSSAWPDDTVVALNVHKSTNLTAVHTDYVARGCSERERACEQIQCQTCTVEPSVANKMAA